MRKLSAVRSNLHWLWLLILLLPLLQIAFGPIPPSLAKQDSDEKGAFTTVLASFRDTVQIMDTKIIPTVSLQVDQMGRHKRFSPGAWNKDDEESYKKLRAELARLVFSRNSAAQGYNQLAEYLMLYKNWSFTGSGIGFQLKIDPLP